MLRFHTSFVLSFILLVQLSVPVVAAKEVTLDLNPVCCELNYEVYGDAQPSGSTYFDRADKQYKGNCQVKVEIDRSDQEEAEEDAREKIKKQDKEDDLLEKKDAAQKELDALSEQIKSEAFRSSDPMIERMRAENRATFQAAQRAADADPSILDRDSQSLVRLASELDRAVVMARMKAIDDAYENNAEYQRLSKVSAAANKAYSDEITPSGPSALLSAGESLVTPLRVLFEASGTKKALVDLAKWVFQGHTEKYHAFMDEELFGKVIAQVTSFQASTDLQKFVGDLSEKNEGRCSADNPTPDCVVERAMCNYEKYSQVLFYQSGQSLAANVTSDNTSELLALLEARDAALLEEVQHAHQALDTALAVYSQFYETYRLHLRFKALIAELVKVRNVTTYLHELVGCIPNKFVGVATTKCN